MQKDILLLEFAKKSTTGHEDHIAIEIMRHDILLNELEKNVVPHTIEEATILNAVELSIHLLNGCSGP